MKLLFFVGSFLTSLTVLAAAQNYSLQLDLSVNDVKVVSSQMDVVAADINTVSRVDRGIQQKVDVIVDEGAMGNRKGILLKFTLTTVNKGQSKVIGKPQLLLQNNEQGSVVVKSGSDRYALSARVKRK